MRTARRPSAILEVLILAVAVVIFGRLHSLAGHDVAAAEANARTVQAVESALRLDPELAANGWLVAHPAFVTPAVFAYRGYYLVVAGVLVWVYVRHPRTYLRARRALLLLGALALVTYWAVPLAPPRLAMPGIVDIVALHDVLGVGARVEGANQYSAMPSMHVGWTAWCAYAGWAALRRDGSRPARPGREPRPGRDPHPGREPGASWLAWRAWLAWLAPAVMVAVVLTTGNHYVLDIVGSAIVVAASVGLAHLLPVRRRAGAQRAPN